MEINRLEIFSTLERKSYYDICAMIKEDERLPTIEECFEMHYKGILPKQEWFYTSREGKHGMYIFVFGTFDTKTEKGFVSTFNGTWKFGNLLTIKK